MFAQYFEFNLCLNISNHNSKNLKDHILGNCLSILSVFFKNCDPASSSLNNLLIFNSSLILSLIVSVVQHVGWAYWASSYELSQAAVKPINTVFYYIVDFERTQK